MKLAAARRSESVTSEPTNDRRRILIVGMRPPRLPLRDGYVLHLYHLLKELHAVHDVTFLTIEDAGHGFADIEGLRVLETSRSNLKRVLRSTIAATAPDVVHAIGAPMASVVRSVDHSIRTVLGALDAPHLNVDAVDATGLIKVLRKRVRRARSIRAIRRQYGEADRVVVVSEEDAVALREVNPDLHVSVIPNGVDLEGFAPRPAIARQAGRLLFTGALNYPPNVATARFVAEEVMPKVLSRQPSARLSLVGRDPGEIVERLGELDGVDVVGPVDDMGDALAVGAVYVCPMVAGTGIKNKLLEALANGLPCVASPLAIRGTDLTHGLDVLVGDGADEVADLIVELLVDDDLRLQLGEAGRKYVADHHSWSSVANRFSRIYGELLSDSEPS